MKDSIITLDPNIRDWVLLPILLVMFLQGVLRQHIGVLLKDEKKPTKSTLQDIQNAQQLRRSARIRANCIYLPTSGFRMRKAWFLSKALAEPKDKEGEVNDPLAQMQDPFTMVNMMKQQMSMVIPNMVLLGWVTYFFSGFVLVKLPFGLTDRFKSMTQRGIGLHSLDVSYVSSLSWYFLVLFGLRGLFDLVLGEHQLDEAKLMQQQMAMGMPGSGAPGQNDLSKLRATERTEMEIVPHHFAIADAEWRLVGEKRPH